MNRKVSILVIIGLIFLVISGCEIDSNPFTTGSFTLTINSENTGRTILPDVGNSIASYLIDFVGASSLPSMDTTVTSVPINLPTGMWDINVSGMDGLNGTGAVVAAGTVHVTITAGQTDSATVVLVPSTSGTGSIDIDILWPAAQAIDNTSTIIFGGTTYAMTDTEVTFDGAGGTISFQIDPVGTGDYTFFAYLNQSGVLQASVAESVQIYENLTSSATITLAAADFTQPPDQSTLLFPVAENNQIILIWENPSNVIIGFNIERSPNDETSYAFLAATDGITLTYSDTPPDSGTIYFYRVIATSAGGTSTSTNSVSLAVAPPVPGGGGILTFSDTTSETTTLSWTKAADNVSAESALEYKIVRSESNDVDTVLNAESNGNLVQDWTPDIATVQATDLTAGTEYFFNVLVRDEAGNINIYTMNSETPLNGLLNLTIMVTEPNDETIIFSETDDITVSQNGSLTITVSENGFESWSWYLDGVDAGQTINTFNYVPGTSLGVHHLTVFVTKNSMLYSNTIRFTVTN